MPVTKIALMLAQFAINLAVLTMKRRYMRKSLILNLLAVCFCVLASCNADNTNVGATNSNTDKSILTVLPKIDQVIKVTARCYYNSSQGKLTTIPEFEIPPDQWNDVLTILAQSTAINTNNDMTSFGQMKFTTVEEKVVELRLLMTDRMHYIVVGEEGPQMKFVADRKGQEIMDLIEKIYAQEKGQSSPK